MLPTAAVPIPSIISRYEKPRADIRRFDELQSGAKEEILVFNKAPYVVPERVNQLEFDALKRGVQYRGIYEVTEALDTAALSRIKQLRHGGRTSASAPRSGHQLAVFDRRVSLFQLIDPGSPEHRTTLVGGASRHGAGLLQMLREILARSHRSSRFSADATRVQISVNPPAFPRSCCSTLLHRNRVQP